ncbi:hypothetical protein PVK64_19860 [Aliivibrio sp. S4TY2]|uniref:cytolethal distending toxin subunit A/C n=1 Tax=unclassified Aliivibrio TaxID=2645654 RepID=UPI0023792EDB|nr:MULTISPECIES: cytolethal distending toxin subunit A/C [unclassified Aliivibrio]MDD9158425.1 hypothetical protein [Aliivibrio sp. S4TY2]MDD9162425.1 hypothetical protein [Aliivibrio sp. S4TY1]MDD9166432.1 hypothetical protein [Aliivibrio sp. S4MY2]MDD9170438.1 hypothetical protein [Aliivibrio sp. S4MY4]MDD9187511.1 hypothetical protein [Aliivibrio sp. S4MY3]
MIKKLVFIVLPIVTGCSSSGIGDYPEFPHSKMELVGEAGKIVNEKNVQFFSPNNTASIDVSLLSAGGAVLTVWARPVGNWLWGYTPFDSSDFGNNRNWKIIDGVTEGRYKFVNSEQGSCIEAYKNGVIHNTCVSGKLSQEFELIPLMNGAVSIKNVDTSQCLRAEFLDRTIRSPYAFSIFMEQCTDMNNEVFEQQWIISPPIQSSLANIIIPTLVPPLPVKKLEPIVHKDSIR